ncbi:hypothetical protein TRL7639_02926 [Falsiruegeria litorea R37]|uniref:Uncharacterized protein n=1 Tax=Falsiruegeria litorea R37 TaxID=1200284 RepID=A0A1Y5T3K4_9RHOB|nr:hypothetical protein [Falsiruegeria litorea]SLN55010.1 hypothetical protein TRL7639_02926 [Falsiruegeria litorea R37]
MRLLPAALALTITASAAFAQQATVSGTDGNNNALGTVPCAAPGAALQNCHAELRRKEGGGVTLAVQIPGGDVRRIYFEDGKPTSSSSPTPISHEVQGGIMRIFIEPGEVFEVPADAVQPQ